MLKESNRELIKKSGFVFYLMGDVLTLEQRIIKDKKNKKQRRLGDC